MCGKGCGVWVWSSTLEAACPSLSAQFPGPALLTQKRLCHAGFRAGVLRGPVSVDSTPKPVCPEGQSRTVSYVRSWRSAGLWNSVNFWAQTPGCLCLISRRGGLGRGDGAPTHPSMVLPLASSVLRAAFWAGVSRGQRRRFCSTWGSEVKMMDASMSHTSTPRSSRSEVLSRGWGTPCRTAGQREPGPMALPPFLSCPRAYQAGQG